MTTPRSPRVVLVGINSPLGRCLTLEYSMKKGKILVVPGLHAEDVDYSFMKELGAAEVIVENSYSTYNDWKYVLY